MRAFVVAFLVTVYLGGAAAAEEVFVTIQKVNGNRMAVVEAPVGGRGGAARAGAARGGAARAGGRFGGDSFNRVVIVNVPADAKITSAMRERRTFEFRVGAELAGGLRHRIFQQMRSPLSARIVTVGNRITQVNVLTAATDINQTNVSDGATVIAIRPKRPPQKKRD